MKSSQRRPRPEDPCVVASGESFIDSTVSAGGSGVKPGPRSGDCMLVLDAKEVTRLLDMPSCIRAVEAAFRARGEGRPTPSAMLGLELGEGSLHAKMASLALSRV